MKVLAESDVHEVVEDIQEIPSDFLVIESHLFSVGLQQPVLESAQKWSPDAFTRTLESVKSMLWGKRTYFAKSTLKENSRTEKKKIMFWASF